MRDVITYKLQINKTKLIITSTFGINMKGTISVNPIFDSYKVRKPAIHLRNPLVITDNHRLYFRDEKTSIKWENRGVVNCFYSDTHKVLLILCDDSRLYVMTEGLELVTKIEWESKFSVCFELIEELGIFLQVGVSEVEVLSMNIDTNVKKTKFLSSMKFHVRKKELMRCDEQTKLKWHKGYGYHLNSRLFWVWSLQDINFYSLPRLELKSQIRSLTKKQNSITCVHYNLEYKYTITGLLSGQIKVWRLPLSRLLNQDHILIHTYSHHTKAVDQIVQGLDDRMIISNSSDLTVCLWSLQTFQMLRVYNFMGEYSRIYLYDCYTAFALQDSYLGKLTFGKVMDFITEINSSIIFFDRNRVQNKLVGNSEILSLQLTLGSNLGFEVKTSCLKQKDLNKIDVQYIYPPLKAKGILQIISSPYVQNQYFLLVENGSLFRLRLENGSGRIERSYNIERTQDVQFHALNQIPTVIKFLKIIPPEYDSQIIDNTLEKKEYDQNIDYEEQYQRLKLIAIGCDRGTVIFLSTDNLEKIYTRVTYHREAVTQIESIFFPQQKNFYLFSYCVEHYLKVVKFQQDKVNCIFSLACGSNLSSIKTLDNRVALVFERGFFEIFELTQNDELFTLKNPDATDHEDNIVTIDYQETHKLILTAALDNKIKIWTKYKVLVYEVLLDEGLRYAFWSENLEIMVQHNMKILYLRNAQFNLKQGQIDEINQEYLDSVDSIIMSVKELCSDIDDKTKFNKAEYNQPQKPQKPMERSSFYFQLKKSSLFPQPVKMKEDNKILPKSRIKSKTKRDTRRKKAHSQHTAEEEEKKSLIQSEDLEIMNKHLQQMKRLKKKTNQSILPQIKTKSEDSMFDNFMKSKLINKKILTRRDITLNRIIMKNIIKDHFGNDQQVLGNLKLDF